MNRPRLIEWMVLPDLARVALTTLAVAWLVGCDGDGDEMQTEPATEPVRPASLTLVSGDGQSGTRGSLLDEPFVVRATDASGRPVADVSVKWVVIQGDGVPSRFSSDTDDAGVTSVTYTLGSQLGPELVRAAHEGLAPVDFHTEALAAPATGVAAEAGDGQVARTSQSLADPLVARVTDAAGFGVPDVEVSWSVTAGAGVLSENATRTDRTGRTSVRFTQGPEVGTNIVSAAVSGVDAPATFELEGTQPVTAVVTMKDNAFVAPDGTDRVTILLGDTVRWLNVDTATAAVIEFGPVFDCPEPSGFAGPGTVPVGTTVEWLYADWLSPGSCGARIVSRSVPPGGEHFDSGVLTAGERFRFVPDVAGTWEYVDTLNGGSGTLTAGPDEIAGVQHTATSNQEPAGAMPFDSELLDPGEEFEFVPGVRGTWVYECELHCSLDDLEVCSAGIVVE